MARDDFEGETVAEGRWLYGDVPKRIEIVAFDCDYFYERMTYMAERESGEPHPLNADGLLYYVKPEGEILPLEPFLTAEDAKRWADAQPWHVRWD